MQGIVGLQQKVVRVLLDMNDDIAQRIFDLLFDGYLHEKGSRRLSVLVGVQMRGIAPQIYLASEEDLRGVAPSEVQRTVLELRQRGRMFRLCSVSRFWSTYRLVLTSALDTEEEKEAIDALMSKRIRRAKELLGQEGVRAVPSNGAASN